MRLHGLGYVGLQSTEAGEWKTVGPDVFGMQVGETSDGVTRLRLDSRGYRFALHPGPDNRLLYVGWDAGYAQDLAHAREHLVAQGVEVHEGDADLRSARQVLDLFWFTDPFGIRHEIFTGQHCGDRIFHGSRATTEFNTENGLGHAVFVVPDLQQAVAFWRDVMGFETTDVIKLRVPDTEMWFLRCNERHHCVAFMAIPGLAGLDHVMVETTSMSEVGQAYQAAKRHGLKMQLELGEHYMDRTTSFYARVPGGWTLELGWGAQLTDEQWVTRYFDVSRPGGSSEVWGHEFQRETGPAEVVRPVGT